MDIVSKAIEIAIEEGAQEVRVSYSEGTHSSFSVLNNDLDKIQSASSRSLYIQLYLNQRYGSYSTNLLNEDDLRKFVRKGIKITNLISPDKFHSLPDLSLCRSSNNDNLEQVDTNFQDISPNLKEELVLSIAEEMQKPSKGIIATASEYEDSFEKIIIADSNGFKGEINQSFFSVFAECTVKGEGHERPQNYWHDNSIIFKNVPKGCGEKAVERALSMLNPQKIKSGRYNVIFENTISTKAIAPIISALSGNAIQQENSFLLKSLGKKIFPDQINIYDRPHIVGEMGARYFDNEGLATKDLSIVKDGVIETYFLSTYYAKKLNLKPSISSPSILFINQHGAVDKLEMMKELRTGILITGFIGGNCNIATGNFSYGIEGYYFEDGEIKHPIKEMNITSDIISLWQNSVHIGNDYRNNRWKIPSLSFKNIDISGT